MHISSQWPNASYRGESFSPVSTVMKRNITTLGSTHKHNFLQCIIQVGAAHQHFQRLGLVTLLLNIKGLCGNFPRSSQLMLHLRLLGLCQQDGHFICFLSSISFFTQLQLYPLAILIGNSFDFSSLCFPDFSWSETQTFFKKEKY